MEDNRIRLVNTEPGGDPNEPAWIFSQTVETLYLPTITLVELRFAIAVMPEGKRKCSWRVFF